MQQVQFFSTHPILGVKGNWGRKNPEIPVGFCAFTSVFSPVPCFFPQLPAASCRPPLAQRRSLGPAGAASPTLQEITAPSSTSSTPSKQPLPAPHSQASVPQPTSNTLGPVWEKTIPKIWWFLLELLIHREKPMGVAILMNVNLLIN